MKAKRAAFWLAVGGTAILAPFALRLAADKLPIPGLREFVGFINKEAC